MQNGNNCFRTRDTKEWPYVDANIWVIWRTWRAQSGKGFIGTDSDTTDARGAINGADAEGYALTEIETSVLKDSIK